VISVSAQSLTRNRLAKAPSTPQKIALRAKIVLRGGQGLDSAHRLWRQRFVDLGLAGLAEAPRPGRPATVDPEKVRRVLTEVVQPPKHRKRWSCRSMARHVGLSKATVQRLPIWFGSLMQIRQGDLRAGSPRCPSCSGMPKMHRHGRSPRKGLTAGLQRYRCPWCHGTVSVLEEGMLPYRKIAAAELEQKMPGRSSISYLH
jgi:hypothetical protein